MEPILHNHVSEAVAQFWRTRSDQSRRQGHATGQRDQGSRTAVTGGRQLDGFVTLVRTLLIESGLDAREVRIERRETVLPGFFRPTKEWDLAAVVRGRLLATIEFKSQVGPSFGNNFNNRAEEALGSAHDLWTACREGAFGDSPRPWLGYLVLLEDCPGSQRPVGVDEPLFPVFSDFRGTSYAQRYAVMCQRLVRERLYDAACLVLSNAEQGLSGGFTEPDQQIGFGRLAAALVAHARTHAAELRGAG